jgi:hypothetical protein
MVWRHGQYSTKANKHNKTEPHSEAKCTCTIGADETKTTKELPAPTWKRRRQNDDDIQPTKNDNQLHPKPAEPEQQAETAAAVVVVNPPNAAAKAMLTQSWWDTREVI